eukprot:352984-Chlamydomonas_euryale.AAC.1
MGVLTGVALVTRGAQGLGICKSKQTSRRASRRASERDTFSLICELACMHAVYRTQPKNWEILIIGNHQMPRGNGARNGQKAYYLGSRGAPVRSYLQFGNMRSLQHLQCLQYLAQKACNHAEEPVHEAILIL